ncbi:MAG: AI-2E family transporter [Steroidobacteraceae bacterium]
MTLRDSRVAGPAIIVGLLVFVYLVRSILLPFVAAGIVAYVCTPLVDWLAGRVPLPRWVFALAVVAALMAVAALVGWLGVPALVAQTVRVTSDLHGAVAGFLEALIGQHTLWVLGEPINAASLATRAVEGLRGWLAEDAHVGYLAALGVAGFFGIILTWVLLGYFLIDAHRFAQGLLALVPPVQRPFVARVWSELDPLLMRYFVGVALVVVYASCAAYIGLGLALGLHHAVFLAMLTGLLELIPIAGPAAAAIIAGLVAVRQAASAWNIVAYIVYATALRVSIDEFFGPIVLGRAARVRPVVVIFCFLAGGVLFGIVGVILAVPVALSVKVVLANLYGEPHTELR